MLWAGCQLHSGEDVQNAIGIEASRESMHQQRTSFPPMMITLDTETNYLYPQSVLGITFQNVMYLLLI